MQFRTTLKLIGFLLMMFSSSMLTPIVVNFVYQDGQWQAFFFSFIVTALTGLLLWAPNRHQKKELKTRDGFLIVSLFWVVICCFSALPFIFSIHPNNGLTDSLFESVSGFTTSGATVFFNLDKLPHDILFYRQQLQFLGGMGIIVLAVAILPMLGIGGLQLYKAETPGPLKDTKLTPRITETAKTLWFIYLGLTALCFCSYHLAGMSWFDAIGESFATVSTGGFSLHSQSFAYYHSSAIELIGCVFMFLGGINFSLHFFCFKHRRLIHYWQDEECRFYLMMVLAACMFITLSLLTHDVFFEKKHHVFIKSLFNVVSLSTTTGYTSASFNLWPNFAPILIMLLAIIGGSASSTSGGIKVIRFLLFFKGTQREIQRLIHPNAILQIKFCSQVLPKRILQSMWGFLSAYITIFIVLVLLLMALDNDLITSFSAVVASLSNAGAGLGGVSDNFGHLSLASKWLLMVAMLLGRLEIFSLLVLFTPSFWRR